MNKGSSRFTWKKTGLLAIALTVGLFGLTACGTSGKENNAGSTGGKPKTTVNIAINGGLNLLTIAKHKGWFEEAFAKAGADVAWQAFQSSVPMLEGISSDRVDFSFLGDGTVVTGKAANSPFTVISVTGVEGNQNSVIVKPDSPIRSIADLKGKSIAIAKGSSAHIFLIKALEKNNLKESDVKLVQLQPDEANPAFQANRVDAWGIWDPMVTIETSANRARIVESVKTMNFLAPALMIGRDKFLKEHPDLTAIYLKTYSKAAEWVKNNPDEAAEILANDSKMDKAIVKTIISNNNYINAPVSPDIEKAIQSTADILLDAGTIKQKLDASKVYDNQYLTASEKL